VVVIDYTPEFERAASQVPSILARPTLTSYCSFELKLEDPEIAATPYARRRFHVLRPSGSAA
jgi:hypothetical protein